MIPKFIIHMLSGGLDSVTLLHHMHDQGHKIHCLPFDYGQQHKQELLWATDHCRKLDVPWTTVTLPKLGGLTDESWIVPNRNAIMLSIAVNYAIRAGADTVTIGCNRDDEATFPDCRMAFLEMFNKTLLTAEIQVEVSAPFLTWPKSRIARLASDMGIKAHDFWSCYRGGEKPCGNCPACLKNKEVGL